MDVDVLKSSASSESAAKQDPWPKDCWQNKDGKAKSGQREREGAMAGGGREAAQAKAASSVGSVGSGKATSPQIAEKEPMPTDPKRKHVQGQSDVRASLRLGPLAGRGLVHQKNGELHSDFHQTLPNMC